MREDFAALTSGQTLISSVKLKFDLSLDQNSFHVISSCFHFMFELRQIPRMSCNQVLGWWALLSLYYQDLNWALVLTFAQAG